jgi:hypothetical protein
MPTSWREFVARYPFRRRQDAERIDIDLNKAGFS